jgi:hypothetical protein
MVMAAHSLRLDALQILLLTLDITCEPKGGKEEEPNACADGARIVRPCNTQEAGILVVPEWYDWNGRCRVQERVTEQSYISACHSLGRLGCITYPFLRQPTTNLKTPCLSGARNWTSYFPGSPETGGSAMRTWGSSMVNSSCMSVMPE